MNKCIVCGSEFKSKRLDAKTCSAKCRVTLSRKSERGSVTDINKLLKAKGLQGVIKGSELPPISFVTSGIKELDELTGGFPRKRITEIFGLKGVGKTTLMTGIINAVPDLKVFYVDAENALTKVPDNIEVFNEFGLERVSEAVEVVLQTNDYDLIVIDSVAALLPWAEMEGDAGDAHMGLKARLMGQWMRRINYWLSKTDTAVVFINQQRETMNPYGAVRFTPGGFALGYASSLRIELKSNKADKKEKYQLVNAIIEKSRFSKPYESIQFKLYYM